jgi:hypothetical protein
MVRRSVAFAAAVLLLSACASSSDGTLSGSTTPSDDAGVPSNGTVGDAGRADAGSALVDGGRADAGSAPVDGGRADASSPPVDGGPADASSPPVDAGRTDAGSAPVDAGPTCNALTFGQPESIFIVVPSSQFTTLTGGTIVAGTYDLVAVETSSSASSAYTLRATWKFAANTIDSIDQLKTSALGPLVNRSASIAVSGGTITRSYTCGSSDATPATLNYDSKVVGGFQTIRIQSGMLRLTLEKRP